VAALAVVLLFAAAGLAGVEAAPDPFQAMDVERGVGMAPAPDLAFQSLDGREVRLRELRGKVVLLGFFSTS
jgi:cytochrome oxidase Cu insertion factor (SCO1/SenC/PrrC family)